MKKCYKILLGLLVVVALIGCSHGEEPEEGVFFEDRSNDIMTDDNLARLMTFPNVLVTSHMGFFTQEAMQAIAIETMENAYALENGLSLVNQVVVDGAR